MQAKKIGGSLRKTSLLLVLVLCFAVSYHVFDVKSVGGAEFPEKKTEEIKALIDDTKFWAEWWERRYKELKSVIDDLVEQNLIKPPPEELPEDLQAELNRWVGTESYEEVYWKMKTRALERWLEPEKGVEAVKKRLESNLSDRPAEEKAESMGKLMESMSELDLTLENAMKTVMELGDSMSEGKLGSCVSIENKVATSDTYDNKLGIETKVETGKVELTVSSGEEMKKTIVINIDNQTLPISSPTDVSVLYDGGEISLADNYEDVLNPLDDNSPEYLLLLGKNGMQVLASVSLSEHKLTIQAKTPGAPAGPSEAAGPSNIWLLAGAGIGVGIAACLAFAFYRKVRR